MGGAQRRPLILRLTVLQLSSPTEFVFGFASWTALEL